MLGLVYGPQWQLQSGQPLSSRFGFTNFSGSRERCDTGISFGHGGAELYACGQRPEHLAGWNYYSTQAVAFNALADILANLVARFPTVKYWELFNEMDSPGFTTLFTGANQAACPIQRGQIYGQMLTVVVPAARQVNPNIHILMGGMGGAPDVILNSSTAVTCKISSDFDTGLQQTMADFLTGIYRVGAGSEFDIVNAHAYADSTFGYGNSSNIDIAPRFAAISQSLHQVVSDQGDTRKQFWVTEFGTSGVDDISSGTCDVYSALGPCMDQAQVTVLGNVINELMQYTQLDVAIMYAISPAGGTLDQSYDRYLLNGMTVNDYGFQLLRSDGITPRPIINWLIGRSNCLSHGGRSYTTTWTCGS